MQEHIIFWKLRDWREISRCRETVFSLFSGERCCKLEGHLGLMSKLSCDNSQNPERSLVFPDNSVQGKGSGRLPKGNTGDSTYHL